jgi:hypothetical protein
MLREVHISGPPGSGKSYLGETLSKDGFFVVDMDDFFQPGDARWETLELLKTEGKIEELRRAWHQMKEERFSHYRNQHPIGTIVWVGLTDHAGPQDEPFYPITNAYNNLFYIDVTDETLCRQYYTRIFNTKNPDWLNVPGSDVIVKGAADMKCQHILRGYVLMSSDQIRQKVLLFSK